MASAETLDFTSAAASSEVVSSLMSLAVIWISAPSTGESCGGCDHTNRTGGDRLTRGRIDQHVDQAVGRAVDVRGRPRLLMSGRLFGVEDRPLVGRQ
jgi:hypothetical protein